MVTKERIQIKGSRTGILISLDDQGEWSALVQELTAKLTKGVAFFQGAHVTVDVGARPVSGAEWAALVALLQTHQVALDGVLTSDREARLAARAQGLELVIPPSPPLRAVAPSPLAATDEAGNRSEGVLVHRTLRSGQIVRHPGHVVILGDVHAGAEIVAGGDVVVWGSLRGTVHAGALGDESAAIHALHLVPTQLRIAGRVSRPPEGGRKLPGPEVARIQGNAIIVEAWVSPRK